MLCESLFHLLLEKGVLSQRQVIEAIDGVAELIDEAVEYDSHPVNTRAAAVLIQRMRESFARKD